MTYKTNLFLDALPAEDREPLLAMLTPVTLAFDQILFEPDQPIRHIYLPIDAVIGTFAAVKKSRVEVCLFGRDGIVGTLAIGRGVEKSGAVVRIAGRALRGNAAQLRRYFSTNQRLLYRLLSYQTAVFDHALQAAACIALHSAESRFAHWLMRVADLHGPEFVITQAQIADSIALRRTTVSVLANQLREKGALSYSRGRIEVRNIEKLRSMACECHGAITSNYRSLLREVRGGRSGSTPQQSLQSK